MRATRSAADRSQACAAQFEQVQEMRRQVEAAQAAAAESQSGERPVERRGPGFRMAAFMGGFIQGAADKVSRRGEARREAEDSAEPTPRPSDAAQPPEAVPAVYPVRATGALRALRPAAALHPASRRSAAAGPCASAP